MSLAPHPLILELNTRHALSAWGAEQGRPLRLSEIPEQQLNLLKEQGYDGLWLMGMWQTCEAGREFSRRQPEVQEACQKSLGRCLTEDICGSPYAIAGYRVHADFGEQADLLQLRRRLRDRGMLLILDFIPNHVGLEHPWLLEHPDYFLPVPAWSTQGGHRLGLMCDTLQGRRCLAFGRANLELVWQDTLQLNFSEPQLQAALQAELLQVAELCDGVRCDMAHLLLPERFAAHTQLTMAEFWSDAIGKVKKRHRNFLFIAEAYEDLGWPLLQRGFDYVYDRDLYCRMRRRDAPAIRGHLRAAPAYRDGLVHFLENHDEERALAVFGAAALPALSLCALSAPGLRLFFDGQAAGESQFSSVHLARKPEEVPHPELSAFYAKLRLALQAEIFHYGEFTSLEPQAAWEGNPSHESYVIWLWSYGLEHRLVVVNLSEHPAQAYVRLPAALLSTEQLADPGRGAIDLGSQLRASLHCQLTGASYLRTAHELTERGLFIDVPAWGYHLFQLEIFEEPFPQPPRHWA